MALSISTDQVDESGRELLIYGTQDFPIAFYDDDYKKIKVAWHWHDELEFVIVTEGSIKVKIANSEFQLNKGDGYFANSGILHVSEALSYPVTQHALVFSPKIISPANDLIWDTYVAPIVDSKNPPYIKLFSSIPWQREILRLADSAWNQGAYERKDYPINVRSSLTNTFKIIKDHLELLVNESKYTDKFQRDELRIKKALAFIENNYFSNITIDDIAKSVGISVSSCLRLFKNVLDTTPVNYLVKLRLQKAVDALLNNTDKNINEIAYSCGFSDASYFNRCFKKEYGITPKEYRSL